MPVCVRTTGAKVRCPHVVKAILARPRVQLLRVMNCPCEKARKYQTGTRLHGPTNSPVLLITTYLIILVSELRRDHRKCLGSKSGDGPKKMDPPKPCQLWEQPQRWSDCRSMCMSWIRAARQPQAVTWLARVFLISQRTKMVLAWFPYSWEVVRFFFCSL